MNRKRIAIIGAGAVGSYYGARLAEAGHDVSFLLRRDYAAVRNGGLRITSPDGDFILPAPNVAQRSEEIGPVDWVICALKSHGPRRRARSRRALPASRYPHPRADERLGFGGELRRMG